MKCWPASENERSRRRADKERYIPMAKKKVEEKINLDAILFKCRDILRKARNSGSFLKSGI